MGTTVNKLMEAAMALLQATPDQQMNIVVLNKALKLWWGSSSTSA